LSTRHGQSAKEYIEHLNFANLDDGNFNILIKLRTEDSVQAKATFEDLLSQGFAFAGEITPIASKI